MTQPEIITAIDVGTTKVLALVAAMDGPGEPRILAHSMVPCEGLRRGNVEDVGSTTAAVRSALDWVESEAGLEVRSAYVGASGAHVGYENRRDPVEGVGTIGVITPEELAADPPGRTSELADDRQVVHAVPISYTVDGEEGIRNPVGMHSASVEVDTHLITADRKLLARLTRAVRAAGIGVDALVMEPLASGIAVLSPEEMQCGTMVIDIGGGTSDVVVFSGGRLCYTGVIPVGGYQFTNDVCVTYNAEYDAAERAKLQFGHTQMAAVDPTQMISLPLRDRPAQVTVSARELAQLLGERAAELAKMVRIKLEEAEAAHIASSKAVLTGGASELPGMADIFQRHLGRAVRLGSPAQVAQGAGLADPAHATGIGMLMWASTRQGARGHVRRGVKGAANGSNGGGLGRYLRGLMMRPRATAEPSGRRA